VTVLYHLTTRSEWERARTFPEYTAPSLAAQGFLHASASLEQLLWVANRRFPGAQDVVVLCIDRALVKAEIRYEHGGHKEPFPHVYGPLNTDAIVEVRRLRQDRAGAFVGWA